MERPGFDRRSNRSTMLPPAGVGRIEVARLVVAAPAQIGSVLVEPLLDPRRTYGAPRSAPRRRSSAGAGGQRVTLDASRCRLARAGPPRRRTTSTVRSGSCSSRGFGADVGAQIALVVVEAAQRPRDLVGPSDRRSRVRSARSTASRSCPRESRGSPENSSFCTMWIGTRSKRMLDAAARRVGRHPRGRPGTAEAVQVRDRLAHLRPSTAAARPHLISSSKSPARRSGCSR